MGSSRGVEVGVVAPRSRSLGSSSTVVPVGDDVVVELVAIVDPGTTSGRSSDAQLVTSAATANSAAVTCAARVMARDPIDWAGESAVGPEFGSVPLMSFTIRRPAARCVLLDRGGRIFLIRSEDPIDPHKPEWLEAAQMAFHFIRTQMTKDGRLFHAHRAGEAKAPATASDYANLIRATLALASAAGRRDYVEQALAWTEVMDRHYWAHDLGGYHLAADDTKDLIVRPLSGLDDAAPNANAVMVSNLVALSLWTGETRYANRAEEILRAVGSGIAGNPVGYSGLLGAAIDMMAPALVVLIVPEGEDASAMRAALRDVSLPNAVIQEIRESESPPDNSPAHGKTATDGKVTAYVCLGPQCSLPVTEPLRLVESIKAAREVTVA